MIKSIHIQNYRSHKNTFINFDKGVNLITGSNDCGKSNILKSISTVIENRPSGDDYISHWGGDMSVRINFDKHSIVRYKSVTKDRKTGNFKAGNKNFYILINKNKSENQIEKDYKKAIKNGKDFGCVEIFKSFGQGVPDKIKKILNMGQINISKQLDGPFLLAKSAPDVAKFYNKIVNLDIIDSTISNISKILKSEEKQKKTEKVKREEKQEELKSFDWIEKIEIKIKKYEKIQKEIKEIKSNWSLLFQLNKDLKKLNKEKTKIKLLTKYKDKVNNLINLDNDIKKNENLFDELEELENKLNFYSVKINRIEQIIKYEKDVNDLIGLFSEVSKYRKLHELLKFFKLELYHINRLNDKYTALINYKNKVDSMISTNDKIDLKTAKYNELFDLKEELDSCNESLIMYEDDQAILEEELKENFPNECPLCGNNFEIT